MKSHPVLGHSATRPLGHNRPFLRHLCVSALLLIGAYCPREGAAQGTPAGANRAPVPVECGQRTPTANELAAPQPPANNLCLTGIRYIRVNVHFVQDWMGRQNFGPVDLSTTLGMDDNGYRWAQALLWAANWPGGWSANPQMTLPVGNTTPTNPKRIQLVLTGVYFDKCSNLAEYDAQGTYDFFSNGGSSYLFDKFGKNKSNTVNIFVMNSKDPNYVLTGGIASGLGPTPAQGCWVKILAPWKANYTAATTQGTVHGAWAYADILNHELGHVFGLAHTFVEPWNPNAPDADGLADTPNNPKCWDNNQCAPYFTPPRPASNNVMDYSAYSSALTPMQITRIHNIIGANQQALVEACGACGPTHAIYGLRVGAAAVTGAYSVASGSLVMNGSASVNESSFDLTIYPVGGLGCTTPVGPVFLQSYYQSFDSYTLSGVTYGAGDINLSSLYPFQTGKVYRIRLRTYNGCSTDLAVQTVHTYTSAVIPQCSISRPAPAPASPTPALGGLTLEAHPNPASRAATLTYYLPTEGPTTLVLLNAQGQAVRRLLTDAHQQPGKHEASLQVQDLPNGLYRVVVTSGGKRAATQLLIRQ